MKKIFIILLCGIMDLGMIGCRQNKNDEHSFDGKVVEVFSTYIIVEPNEGEEERKSSDRFRIDLKDSDTSYEIGTSVKITYIGGINESYPSQIGTTKIEVEENKQTEQYYSKTIGNVILEMAIPNEWQYEELPRDENNDFYQYALKLYKSDVNKNTILYFYNSPFTVCGTGRTTQNINLDNGKQGVVGYYGGAQWSDISFYELNPNIAFINNGLEGEEAEEVLDIVTSINIK